ncbi:hypothetical protein [Rhodopseudomonas boonkerdii]|uniref:hypothetical protein n=1 Tax=Rhodopseudomonas boonkerdii TaxID=475937 RepID=UPI001E4A0EAA|nr:hypothetical protein [Rhodopseudomonas boonkerdii]
MGRRAGDDDPRFETCRDADGWCVRDRATGEVVTCVTPPPTGLFRIEAELLRDQLNQTPQRRPGARRDA